MSTKGKYLVSINNFSKISTIGMGGWGWHQSTRWPERQDQAPRTALKGAPIPHNKIHLTPSLPNL